MVIQKRENDLVLATHGRGIMIIDDPDSPHSNINEYQNKVQGVIENKLPAINDMIIKDGKNKIIITTREKFFE